MSDPRSRPKHSAMLNEMALDALLESPHLAPEYLPFVTGLTTQAAQGLALRLDQVARVSRIRADIAKACNGAWEMPEITPEWDGAA